MWTAFDRRAAATATSARSAQARACFILRVRPAPRRTAPSAKGIEEQAALVYSNITTILKACGMGLENLVKLTIFLTDADYIDAWRAAQKEALGNVVPASTLLIVSRLARPEFLVEVEAVAAID